MDYIIESELCKFLILGKRSHLTPTLPHPPSSPSRPLSRILSPSTTVHSTTSSLRKLPTLCELPLILINVVGVDVVASTTWPAPEFLRVYRCARARLYLSTTTTRLKRALFHLSLSLPHHHVPLFFPQSSLHSTTGIAKFGPRRSWPEL